MQGEQGKHHLAYWRQQLGGELPMLNLPTDNPYPPVQTYNGSSIYFHLDEKLAGQLRELARVEAVGLFTILLSAYQILLCRYTGQEDILVGSPAMGRTRSEFTQIVGYFINMLVLRADLKDELSFKSFLRENRRVVLEALEHQDYPFPELVERLELDRDPSRPPVFQASFVLQYPQQSVEISSLFAPGNTGVRMNLGDIELEPFELSQQEGQFELSLEMMDAEDSLTGVLLYNSDLFEADTITRMVGHFRTLLEGIVTDPAQSIHTLPLLTAVEQQQFHTWNDTETPFPQDKTAVDLFEEQVENNPNRIAVSFEKKRLSFAQLNQQANQLAHYLLKLKSQTESDSPLIAVAVDRSLKMIVSLLAIHKAGAAYVPIDPAYPDSRIRYMLEDSAASVVLTERHLEKHLMLDSLPHPCTVICMDETDFSDQPDGNPLIKCRPDDLAYVIYTSGSTGRPKGAMVEHVGMLNHIYAKIDDLRLTATDVIAHTASLTFDISVWQAFTSLVLGGRVEVVSEEVAKQPQKLLDTVLDEGVSILEIVPSLLRALLEEIKDDGLCPDLSCLRWMILTGEALPPDSCIEWFNIYPDIPLFNAYGPTECSDDVAHYSLYQPPDVKVLQMPIGKPVNNMKLYVLDRHRQLLPVGVAGELYVSGIGVGQGYWNDPEKTAQAFITDHFNSAAEKPLYKTGDLVRWLDDGNIEYLGRIDHQVKLRGFRIECGEIEAVLGQNQIVKEAVVTLYKEDSTKYLVAYITLNSRDAQDGSEKIDELSLVSQMRDWLKGRLPDYMVPSHFTILQNLALTPNGKIDRKALPAPSLNLSDWYEAPRNDTEQKLVQIWGQLLKQNNIGIHDNFFSLGGDSILSIQVVARARQVDLRLTPGDLFEYPTIAELATVVGYGMAVNAEQGLIVGEAPLTPIQQFFWTEDLPEYWHYNQSILLHGPADLGEESLRYALAAVLSHHDALRLRYHRGEWSLATDFCSTIRYGAFCCRGFKSK